MLIVLIRLHQIRFVGPIQSIRKTSNINITEAQIRSNNTHMQMIVTLRSSRSTFHWKWMTSGLLFVGKSEKTALGQTYKARIHINVGLKQFPQYPYKSLLFWHLEMTFQNHFPQCLYSLSINCQKEIRPRKR